MSLSNDTSMIIPVLVNTKNFSPVNSTEGFSVAENHDMNDATAEYRCQAFHLLPTPAPALSCPKVKNQHQKILHRQVNTLVISNSNISPKKRHCKFHYCMHGLSRSCVRFGPRRILFNRGFQGGEYQHKNLFTPSLTISKNSSWVLITLLRVINFVISILT